MLNRRTVLAAAAVAGLARTPVASAQAPAAKPSPRERVAAAARAARRRLDFNDGRFSGAAYDWLVAQGRSSRFFLHGEEHGIAENPKLATQLFRDLVPAGYSRVAVEISAPMAGEIDTVLARGGLAALREFFADMGNNVAFFGMREEAQWLADARQASPAKGHAIWGFDYEVGADRRLIALLKGMPKPAPAQAALERLEAA